MASRIKGITVEIGGDTTGLEKALKGVNSSIKTTQSALKDVERLLKLDPTNTELLTQKQKLLKDAIASTSEKLETLKEAQKQAKEQLERGELGQDKYDALQREIVETEQELKRLQEQAATTSLTLEKIAAAGDKFVKAGDSITNAGKKISVASAAVTGLGVAAVKTAADFDSAMANVAAISGATGDDLQALRDKAREMGEKTKFSASEAADAMSYMSMAGWKTGDMLSGIEGIMNLAAASGEDLAATSDIVTDALTAFGLTAEDSAHFADILAAASSNANTNVSMMGETFKYCAPVAGALGYSAEDVAEAIGLMGNAGIKSTQAGTALRTMMTKLQGELKLSGEALGEVTIQTANADGSMRELSDILADCRTAFSKMSESEAAAAAETLVGKNAMSGFLALMNSAPGDIDKLRNAIENCDGSAEDMAAIMQDNLNGQLTILKSQLEELAISFGEMLMPVIRKVVTAVQGFVDKLNNMDEAQRKTIISIGLVIAALGPFLVILGTVISTVGKSMKAYATAAKGIKKLMVAVKSGTGIFGKLGAALGGISAPVLAVVAVIAVLVAAFTHLWKTNDGFRENIIATWTQIKETVSNFCQGIVDRLNSLGFEFSSITEVLKAVWDGFCNLLGPVFEGAFRFISDTLSTVLDVILNTVDFFIAVFSGDWEGAWEAVKNIFSSIWNGLVSWFTNILETIKGVLDVALGWIGTSWEQVWTSVKNFFTNIWNGIKSFISNTINSISTTISNVINGIKTTVSNVFNSIKTTISNIFNGIKDTATNVWNAIKTAITTPIDNAKEKVKAAIDAIKGFFSGLKLELPHIKLPHFSISGKLSLSPPSVPHINIDWYKEGGIMAGPTIFGMNGSSLMAGGEAGKEAILPLTEFYTKLESILTSKLNTTGMERYLAVIAANSGKGIYLDDGTLVGRLLPAIDSGLADYSIRARRGNR
jgi:TP901 family phage tail tape measure protein